MKQSSWLKVSHDLKYYPDQVQILAGVVGTNVTNPLDPATAAHGDWTINDDTDQLTYLGKLTF